MGPLRTVTGDASLTCVLLQTKGQQAQNLSIKISEASGVLKDSKCNVSHSVCVFPVSLHVPHFCLVSDQGRRDRDRVKTSQLLEEEVSYCAGFSQKK